MALAREVVEFIRFRFEDGPAEGRRIFEIRVMEEKAPPVDGRVAVKVFEARAIEGAGSADRTVNLIALFQEEFRQIRTILAGDASDEGSGHRNRASVPRLQLVTRTLPSR